jgi:chaperonin cofactor prefoldin
MSDDDPTKTLPSTDPAQLKTQPSITAVFELIQEVKRTVDSNAARLSAVESQIRETKDFADRRHAEILELFRSADLRHGETNANFRKLGDKMDILNRRVLESEANQVDLRRRIEELETQAS